MKGRSHALSGACAGLAFGIGTHRPAAQVAALGGLTAGMALLNDLDSCGSCAARSLGLLSRAVAYVIRLASGGHRHATHSLAGVAVFGALAWLACYYRHDDAGRAGLALLICLSVSAGAEALRLADGHTADLAGAFAAAWVAWLGSDLALIAPAVLLGCATHIAGDMLTDSGCPLLWPVSRYRFRVLPEPFAFTTGTGPELYVVDPALMTGAVLLGGWAVDPALLRFAWAAVLHSLP